MAVAQAFVHREEAGQITDKLAEVAVAAVGAATGGHELPQHLKLKVSSGQAMNDILTNGSLILIDAPTRRIVAIVPSVG